jgi:DNA-nicking Smr family endonuclease
MARPKTLSKADLQLWAAFTQAITPLPGKSRLPLDPPPPPPQTQPPRTPDQPLKTKPRPTPKPLQTDATPAGVDKSTWQKFASGKRRPEKKLDLHGLTATRAHHATTAFIQHAALNQIRCIEIVTGKGEILARELPHWLNTPSLRPLILAITHAPTANTGAIRILLRRTR